MIFLILCIECTIWLSGPTHIVFDLNIRQEEHAKDADQKTKNVLENSNVIPVWRKKQNGKRLVIREDMGNRLADSVETALQLADGLLIAENADTEKQTLFSEKFACPVSGFTIPEIEPRLFSFNSPHGACPPRDVATHRADHSR